MAKQLVFRAQCDLCSEQSIYPLDAPAESEIHVDNRLTLNGQAVELDLCPAHLADLENRLHPYMTVGREPEPEPKPKAKPKSKKAASTSTVGPILTPDADNQFPCPDCDYKSINAQGLGAHRSKKHGYVSPNRKYSKKP